MDVFSRTVLLPLAQAPQKSQLSMDQLLAVRDRFDWTDLAVLAAGAVFAVIAYWIAAKIMASDEEATFKNALKIWALSLVVGIVVGITCGIAVPIAVLSGNPLGVVMVLIGALFLGLVLMFALPVKVLEMSPLRALGFWPIALILMVAAQTGLDRGLGREPLRDWSAAFGFLHSNVTGGNRLGLEAKLERLSEPAERQKPISERQANLRAVFEQLQARQRTLPPGDAAAVAAYERQRMRYEELLRVLRVDYARSQAPAGR
jgi:hypothetical protein